MYLLMFMLFFQSNLEPHRLDEINISKFGFSASNGQFIALSYTKDFSFPIGFYNFKTNQVSLVNDQRVKAILPFPVPTKQGFTFINAVPRNNPVIHHFSLEGHFISKEYLADFENWSLNYSIQYISPTEQGKALVTFIEGNELGFLELDIHERQTMVLHKEADPEKKTKIWVNLHETTYQLSLETGEIRVFNLHTKKAEKVVRPQMEPIKMTHKGFQKFSKSDNRDIISQPSHTNKLISIRYHDNSDVLQSLLLKSKDSLTISPMHILGQYEQQSLAYDWENKILVLKPKLSDRCE